MTDMARILTEEHRAGAYGLRDALFFLRCRIWRSAALDLGFYLSMSGIAAFPKSQANCREIFAAAPGRTASWWRPTAPTSPRRPIAASATNPPMSAHTARVGAELFGLSEAEFAAHDQVPISTGCSAKAARLGKGRLRWPRCASPFWAAALRAGVPRLGGHWGDCDPRITRGTAASRCSLLVRTDRGRRRHDNGADRHLPRSAPATAGPKMSGGSTGWFTPMPMPITCTGSTICA